MSKTIRLAFFLALLILIVGCNRPQSSPKLVPTTSEAAADPTDTPVPSQDVAQTQPPADTQPAPTEEEPPTQQPPPPTADPQVILEGERIPLFRAGADVTIRKVEMIDLNTGWGIAQDNNGIDHILRTTDGGYSWRDITPPQPIDSESPSMFADVEFGNAKTGWVTFMGSDLVWSTTDGGITWNVSKLTYKSRLGNMFVSLGPDQVWLYQFLDAAMQSVFTALSSSQDKGDSWSMLFDPTDDTGGSVQGFDKTGGVFVNTEYGWLTRDFRGVTISVFLEVTSDGGTTWQNLELPPPPTDADLFTSCVCGMYDPSLVNTAVGSARLSCSCYLDDLLINKNYLYRTIDGGESWEIHSMPSGEMHFISGQTYYATGREIYRTSDSGDFWDLIKTVNWDGQFSFVDLNNALAIAYDPDDDEYALVKTTNGCSSFEIIIPNMLPSQTQR